MENKNLLKQLNICHSKEIKKDIITPLSSFFKISKVEIVNNRAMRVFSYDVVLTNDLRSFFYKNMIDFALYDGECLPKKLFISDMDSTMIFGESIEDMAKEVCVFDEVSKITKEAMLGNIDFKSSLLKRLSLLKGFPRKRMEQLLKEVSFQEGALELLTYFKEKDVYSILVSGGFTIFSSYVKDYLGFSHSVANKLSFDDRGLFDGSLIGDVIDSNYKRKLLEDYCYNMGLKKEEVIAIGDGANDIPMIKSAGLGVSFKGKPNVRKSASAEIHTGNLKNLIYLC